MTMGRRLLPADRAELLEEAEYVRRSLAELEAEHAAGELDGADYETLRARYEARAEAAERALRTSAEVPESARAPEAGDAATAVRPSRGGRPNRAAGGRRPAPPGASATPSPPETSPKRRAGRPGRWLASPRRRLVVGWSAAGCFALAGCLLGLALAGVAPFARQPPSTLTLAAEIRIELGEASVLASNNDVAQAVAVYDRVLELDPDQPEALADGGWLVRLSGISQKNRQVVEGGDAEIATAVNVAPGYALARAYDGVAVFEDDGSATGAVTQFRAMLADKPSSALVASVAKVAKRAYTAAHDPVPTAFG